MSKTDNLKEGGLFHNTQNLLEAEVPIPFLRREDTPLLSFRLWHSLLLVSVLRLNTVYITFPLM
jgi:hypothetical protein